MKNLITAILILAASNLFAHDTDSILAEAYRCDQEVRQKAMELMKTANENGYTEEIIDSLQILTAEQEKTDKKNQALVKSIFKKKHIIENLSKESIHAIWVITDHAPIKMQKKVLPFIKKLTSKGLISKRDLATITDRIAMKDGMPQKYGTQSHIVTNKDGRLILYIWPVENPQKINTLREEIDEIPIEEYVKILEQTSGCTTIYDPKLTVRDIKNKIKGNNTITL